MDFYPIRMPAPKFATETTRVYTNLPGGTNDSGTADAGEAIIAGMAVDDQIRGRSAVGVCIIQVVTFHGTLLLTCRCSYMPTALCANASGSGSTQSSEV